MRVKSKGEAPQFQSLDEEKAYWEAQGPLAAGKKGRVNRPKPGQRRSSFLAVRLTGEELTRLRDVAAEHGLGPSTFARLLLTAAIARQKPPAGAVGLDELGNALEKELPAPLRERAEALFKLVSAPSSDFLIRDGAPADPRRELGLKAISVLLAIFGDRGGKAEGKGGDPHHLTDARKEQP